MPRTYSYKLKSPTTDQYRSRWPFGKSGAQGKSTSHWLRSGGGKTRADAIYTRPRSDEVIKYEEKRREETEERNAQLITFLQSWVPKLYWPFPPLPSLGLQFLLISTPNLYSDLPSSTALVARVSRRRSWSEFVSVEELPLMTWHRWGHLLRISVVAVGDHQSYTSIM